MFMIPAQHAIVPAGDLAIDTSRAAGTVEPEVSQTLLSNSISTQRWDNHISKFSNSSFFHTSAWKRVLQETYNFTPFYLASIKDSANVFALPLAEVKSPLNRRKAVSLPFTDSCSFLAGAALQNDLAKTLVASSGNACIHPSNPFQDLINLATSRKWQTLELRGVGPGLPISQTYLEHELKLENPDKLSRGLQSQAKRSLQKSLRSGLAVAMETNASAMRQYYHLHCLTRRRHGLPPQPFAFFDNIRRFILEKGNGFIISASQGTQVIASAVFFHYSKKAIYKFGASDHRFQHLRANNLVMWEAITRLASNGFETLNFGRTAPENAGLRRFKLGWGAQETELHYSIYDFAKRQFIKKQGREEGWYNPIFRIMPPKLAQKLGTALYKYLG